jgi:hypothetical protein
MQEGRENHVRFFECILAALTAASVTVLRKTLRIGPQAGPGG